MLRIKYKMHCLISKDICVTVWMFVVLMELCCIVWWFMAVTGRHLLLQSSLLLCVSLCSHQREMRDGNFLWVSLNDPPSHLPPSLFLSRFPFSLSNHPPRSLAFWIFGMCSVPVTLSLSLSSIHLFSPRIIHHSSLRLWPPTVLNAYLFLLNISPTTQHYYIVFNFLFSFYFSLPFIFTL